MMLSSQASLDLNDQSVVQVSMVSPVAVNANNQQPASSTQAVLRAAVTMATVQIPQMRVLQAIASRPGQPQQFQHQVQTIQPQHGQIQQQIQILKAVPGTGGGELLIPNYISTVAGMKTSFASPGKGAAVVTIPGAKMVSHAHVPTKLKVGDTIVIPTKTLSKFNPVGVTAGSPVVIKQEQLSTGQLIFTTPTKLIPGMAKSPMMGSPATPHQSAQVRYVAAQQPTTPSQTLTSPMRLTTISPSSWTPSIKKARRTPTGPEKGSKGLRHFAMLVCEKVKQKITTTYNEVADELVSEYSSAQRHLNDQQYDQKNIRRRVYDALNVLMAMNIIYKDKKDIHWVGLPTNSVQELQALQAEKHRREQKVQQKTAQLHELILQQIAFKNLVQRNKRLQQTQGPPASNSAIQLPFIIVNTSKKTVIDCSISNDKYEYLFNFDNTFEIHDDIEVLKRMGMAYGLEKGSCSKEDLRTAQSLVPPVLRPYLEDMAGINRQLTVSNESSSSSQAIESGIQIQPGIVTTDTMICSPLDGHQMLSGIKTDPEDHEVAMVVNSVSGDSRQSSSSSLTLNDPSSSSRSSSIEVMTAIHHGAMVSSPGLELSGLSTTLSPATFDT